MQIFYPYGTGGGGGAVNSVTASSPIFSSGGANPNITITQNFYDVGTGWPYATIADAITAAQTAVDTDAIIRVNESITEDVNLPRGMTLMSPLQNGQPTIVLTTNIQTAAPFAGTAKVVGLILLGNGTEEILTANASTNISFTDCVFAQGNDFPFLSASAGATVNIIDSSFVATGIATANGINVSGGNVNLSNCSIISNVPSGVFSLISGGSLSVYRSISASTITISGGTFNAYQSTLATSTGPVLQIGAFNFATLYDCKISSSAGTNCIEGSGTVQYSNLVFNNTQKGIDNTITLTPYQSAINVIGNPDASVTFGTSYEFGINRDGGVTPIGVSFPSGSAFRVYGAGSQLFSFSEYQMRVTTNASVGSSIPSLNWEVSSSVSLPSEFNNIYFNLAPAGGQNFASGTLQLQREFRIAAPTYSGNNPGSELVRAVTHAVDGPPSAGTNMTIDLAIGTMVEARNVTVGTSGSVIGNCVFQSGIENGQGDTGIISGYFCGSFSAVNLGNTVNSSTVCASYYGASIQYSAVTNTRTIEKLATFYAAGAPTTSGTVAVTEGPYAFWADSGDVRWDGRVLLKRFTGTPAASSLTLPGDGFGGTLTGNTDIDYIDTTGWTPWSYTIVNFTGTPNINHNSGAVPGGYAAILCEGSANMPCTNGTFVALLYTGTDFIASYWRQP